jgi:hypothetical protein
MATVTLYRANPAPPTLPESATGRASPELTTLFVPACPNERFLDAQLHDLRALQGRIQQISHRAQNRVASCQAGRLPIDVWLAPLLVRFGQDTQGLYERLGTLVQDHRQSLRQAHLSRSRWMS